MLYTFLPSHILSLHFKKTHFLIISLHPVLLSMPAPLPEVKLTFTQSLKKLMRSFVYAYQGIKYATLTQLNFRVHLVAMLIAIAMGYGLHVSYHEWLWIALCITLVLVTELLNTAIETLTDLVSPDYHPKAGQVKDVAAGAVVIMALFALITGLVIFIPKLLKLINHVA
jgi:diacylglycerol kinase (ATP)